MSRRTPGADAAPDLITDTATLAALCARLRGDGHDSSVRAKTGLVLDPYFSAGKIAWLLDHVPDNLEGFGSLLPGGLTAPAEAPESESATQ